MKKLLITLLAVFTVSGAFAQEAFPDIPAGHWAGDAVSRIADLGIVIGFPDGTFRGNESFTRYQAALVISRLLDVIQADMDAMRAMSEADMASLRNALQELASDVASQGVRLSAAESAIAQLSDDVTANAAAIDNMSGMGGDMPPGLMQDIEAARLAADTAQAQADAATALANDALDAVNAVSAQARQNAAAIDAINDLLSLLNEDIESFRGHTHDGSGMMMDNSLGERNRNDIANIREFVILLRRDQVALRDRVSALEDSVARIDDIDARLTEIENNFLTITGSISLDYDVIRLSSDAAGFEEFDIDRAFGKGLADGINDDRNPTREEVSFFTSGESDDGEDDNQAVWDFDTPEDGDVGVGLDLNVSFGTDRSGEGGPEDWRQSFEAVISFDLVETSNVRDTDGDIIDDAYILAVDDIVTRFDPIGMEPLTFQYGKAIEVQFTNYVVDFDDDDEGGPVIDGFVATVGSPDFLSFLDPALWVVYGSPDGTGFDADEGTSYDDAIVEGVLDPTRGSDDTYYRAIRGTLTPLTGDTFSATGGVSFAQGSLRAGERDDLADDNIVRTVLGVDGTIGAGPVDLSFEYAQSSLSGVSEAADEEGSYALAWARATVDTSAVPFVESFEANYRDIPGVWKGFAEDDDYDFDLDQAGFGIDATFKLFIFNIGGYFDTYEYANFNAGVDTVTAYGAELGADLFAGFSVTGFYKSAAINGTTVNDLESGEIAEDGAADGTVIVDAEGAADGGDAVQADARDGNNYETGFGVTLAHDGAAANALISGLDLEFTYEQLEADFSRSRIYAAADYELAVSVVNLTPYASFEIESDSDDGADDTTTIKAGTGLMTDPLNVFLQPSLAATVNYRSTSHTEATAYTASELQFAVGLMLNDFLFEHSTLSGYYTSYSSTNVSAGPVDGSDFDEVEDVGTDENRGGDGSSVSGFEVIWNYFELEFGYGVYTYDPSTSTEADQSAAQAFSISYTVDF